MPTTVTPVTSLNPPAARPAVALRWSDVHVDGMGLELPDRVVPTAELEARIRPLYSRLGFKPGWVEAVTGIAARRMWAEGDDATHGAVRAARKALAEAGIQPHEVDAVVSCSVYKPRLEPSVACEVQGELGIGAHALNFDVGNACLGFLTGLTTVANMIAMGQIEVGLVVAGEDARPVVEATIARLIAPDATVHTFKDHLATLTLGSAATAMVLVSSKRARTNHRLVGGTILAAAEHHGLCAGDAGGMVTDSVALLREGVDLAGRTFEAFREQMQWRPAGLVAAMHQVGKAHHDTILGKLGIDGDAAPRTYPTLGNIGACGVPATTILARDDGRLRPGSHVALMGIGSGLNCAMLGVTW